MRVNLTWDDLSAEGHIAHALEYVHARYLGPDVVGHCHWRKVAAELQDPGRGQYPATVSSPECFNQEPKLCPSEHGCHRAHEPMSAVVESVSVVMKEGTPRTMQI